jgi:hypothetical protein
MSDRSRRRHVALPYLVGCLVAATSIFAACDDPVGNDPNVPDDVVTASSGRDGGGRTGDADIDAASLCPRDLPACPSSPPSYKEDIAPLIQRDCGPCHASGGEAADRDLTTYANLHKIRITVLTQVYGCRMPPADAGGAETGPPGLDSADRLLLLQWLECHSPDN